jgi:hypothetical protein
MMAAQQQAAPTAQMSLFLVWQLPRELRLQIRHHVYDYFLARSDLAQPVNVDAFMTAADPVDFIDAMLRVAADGGLVSDSVTVLATANDQTQEENKNRFVFSVILNDATSYPFDGRKFLQWNVQSLEGPLIQRLLQPIPEIQDFRLILGMPAYNDPNLSDIVRSQEDKLKEIYHFMSAFETIELLVVDKDDFDWSAHDGCEQEDDDNIASCYAPSTLCPASERYWATCEYGEPRFVDNSAHPVDLYAMVYHIWTEIAPARIMNIQCVMLRSLRPSEDTPDWPVPADGSDPVEWRPYYPGRHDVHWPYVKECWGTWTSHGEAASRICIMLTV